jgi:type I restriction enzyme S subunit
MYESVGGSDWRQSSVYDLADWKNGLAFKNIDFSDLGKPIIKIGELKNGITKQTARTLADYDPSVFVQAGNMLFSWSGNPDTSIDVFRWEGEDGWLNQHIFKVKPKKGVSSEFLFFVLRWLKPRFAEIARNKQTTGLGHVTLQDLKRMKLGIPSSEEQLAIISIVGPLQSKIELILCIDCWTSSTIPKSKVFSGIRKGK